MKNLALAFIAIVAMTFVVVNCKSDNTTYSNSYQPVQSNSFGIHDSVYTFYEDFARQIIEHNEEEATELLTCRGFIYQVEVKEGELFFENHGDSWNEWRIKGTGRLNDDFLDLMYTVSSPGRKST